MERAPSGALCFLAWLIVMSFGLVAPAAAQEASAPPNILLVIADDMGLDASPCRDVGARKPTMRLLEHMCAEGIVFDNAYAAPSCSPTRATIMTGRYGFRTGVGAALGRGSPNGLPLDETTLFQFLDRHAPQPYAHAVIGKWHLATDGNGWLEHPRVAGVGYYAGVISGVIEDYHRWPRTFDGETTEVDRYITSALTDEAIEWVRAQENPWFLWLAHVAPHLPLHQPPAELLQSDPAPGDPTGQYLAALEALDSELGRLVESLSPAVRENLIVIFIGDNGSPNQTVQAPFSRGKAKGSLFEGGVRVPLVVWGRGVGRRGESEAALVNSTDLFATIVELAGIEPSDADFWPEHSISFASLLLQAGIGTRDYAYVEHFSDGAARRGNQFGWAITDGRYKLIHDNRAGDMLFDLDADPWEEDDLLAGSRADDADDAYERLAAQAFDIRRSP